MLKIIASPPKYGRFIKLNVRNLYNAKISFQTRENAPLERLMRRYSDMIETPLSDIRFLFFGQRLHPYVAPTLYDIRDNDTIYAQIPFCGGGYDNYDADKSDNSNDQSDCPPSPQQATNQQPNSIVTQLHQNAANDLPTTNPIKKLP